MSITLESGQYCEKSKLSIRYLYFSYHQTKIESYKNPFCQFEASTVLGLYIFSLILRYVTDDIVLYERSVSITITCIHCHRIYRVNTFYLQIKLPHMDIICNLYTNIQVCDLFITSTEQHFLLPPVMFNANWRDTT